MVLLFIISALSIHSFLVHNNPFYVFSEHEKIERVDDSLDQKNSNDKKIIKVKTISNEKKSENVELSGEVSSAFSEDLLENGDLEKKGELSNELSDEYEEIIFEDNFDKEYWEWTEDNYLEE